MGVGDLAAFICGVNTITVPDHYPLLNIANFISRISGSAVFSKLDLQKGYYQVLVASENIQKTAIITPFGMYKFFNLRKAVNNFQCLMDKVLGDLPFCLLYVDNILIYS